jgi:exodeoxyribonuclease VII large subunit
MEVIAIGKITTWSRYKTTYQLDIDNIEIAGEGALLKLIEERKKRLAAKGVFDEKYKKPLPFLPKKIGIITSPTGSVIHDIINRLKERFPVDVDLWATSVQGNEAVEMIINAIKGFNNDYYPTQPEVIIIARGGGSVEDLMVFNDERLAIVVFESKIPIVSAIGHETDTTIIDFASDLRVPTPTAAVEKIVPNRNELIMQINRWSDRLINSINMKMNHSVDFFNNFVRLLKDPQYILDTYNEKFIIINKDLFNSFKFLIEKRTNELQYCFSKLKLPDELFNLKKIQSYNLFKNLNSQISQKTKENINYFKNVVRLLNSSSIDNNLKKGYVLLKKYNKIIKCSKQLKKQDNIQIKFFDKQLDVKIKQS